MAVAQIFPFTCEETRAVTHLRFHTALLSACVPKDTTFQVLYKVVGVQNIYIFSSLTLPVGKKTDKTNSVNE